MHCGSFLFGLMLGIIASVLAWLAPIPYQFHSRRRRYRYPMIDWDKLARDGYKVPSEGPRGEYNLFCNCPACKDRRAAAKRKQGQEGQQTETPCTR